MKETVSGCVFWTRLHMLLRLHSSVLTVNIVVLICPSAHHYINCLVSTIASDPVGVN